MSRTTPIHRILTHSTLALCGRSLSELSYLKLLMLNVPWDKGFAPVRNQFFALPFIQRNTKFAPAEVATALNFFPFVRLSSRPHCKYKKRNTTSDALISCFWRMPARNLNEATWNLSIAFGTTEINAREAESSASACLECSADIFLSSKSL